MLDAREYRILKMVKAGRKRGRKGGEGRQEERQREGDGKKKKKIFWRQGEMKSQGRAEEIQEMTKRGKGGGKKESCKEIPSREK